MSTVESGEARSKWDIYADDERIGSATTLSEKEDDGWTTVHSVVSIEQLRVSELASRLLGPWQSWLPWKATIPDELAITFQARTQMKLDDNGTLQRFETVVDLDAVGPLARFTGERQNEALKISVHTRDADNLSEESELFETTIDIPPEALVADAFSPHPRMANLAVGQSWKFHTYQAFPPGRNLRVAEARCERTELFIWNGDIETVFVVSIRDATASTPTVSANTREMLWVRDDGTVLKQQMRLSNLLLDFRRVDLPSNEQDQS